MPKVIIAEDFEALREMFIDMITSRNRGIEVEVVVDGESLVERVRQENFDLVLTDNSMPKKKRFGSYKRNKAI